MGYLEPEYPDTSFQDIKKSKYGKWPLIIFVVLYIVFIVVISYAF